MTQSDVRRPAPSAAPTAAPTAAAGRPASRHGPVAQLLMACSPLSLILLAYAAAAWVSAPLADGAADNRLGFGLHVDGPAEADRLVFGAVPSVWLQARLVDGTAHWYDAAAALVYVTHFVAIPVLTAVTWTCLRDQFASWVLAVLAFTTLGIAVYVVYPAAPPWMASDGGVIGAVNRISAPGWDYLHLEDVGRLVVAGQESSNPVAAMPSLHAGGALLVALFLWPMASRLGRAVLVGYVLAMALTLVYAGEHYVVDVVAGWLVAALAVTVGVAVGQHRLVRRAPGTTAGRDSVTAAGGPRVARAPRGRSGPRPS